MCFENRKRADGNARRHYISARLSPLSPLPGTNFPTPRGQSATLQLNCSHTGALTACLWGICMNSPVLHVQRGAIRNILLLSPVLGPDSSHRRRRQWQPTPVFLPGKSHGQRSLGLQRVRHDWVYSMSWGKLFAGCTVRCQNYAGSSQVSEPGHTAWLMDGH